MAQSGHAEGQPECPLLGAVQTSQALRAHRAITTDDDTTTTDDNGDSIGARGTHHRITGRFRQRARRPEEEPEGGSAARPCVKSMRAGVW
jgi:hypothetical protein